jgi:hypothetical protein
MVKEGLEDDGEGASVWGRKILSNRRKGWWRRKRWRKGGR